MKSWNSFALYCGPLSVTNWAGMPCSAKMLLRCVTIACELVLVSFLMTGNLLYWSEISSDFDVVFERPQYKSLQSCWTTG